MNNDFKSQLNSACRDKSIILEEQRNREIEYCTQTASFDYNSIKKRLLNEVSNGNYKTIGDKKYVSCLYTPINKLCSYNYDDGVHTEITGIFKNKVKTTDTGIIKYTPRDEHKWHIYANKLKEFCNEDGIHIDFILYSSLYKISHSYPTVTRDKRFRMTGISVGIQCNLEF